MELAEVAVAVLAMLVHLIALAPPQALTTGDLWQALTPASQAKQRHSQSESKSQRQSQSRSTTEIHRQSTQADGAMATKKQERLALVDNARFMCVYLVIFSHCTDWLGVQGTDSLWHPPLGTQPWFWPRASEDLTWPQMVYNHFSLWFMPVVTFLSGLGSQAELTSVRAERMLIYVVAPIFLVYGSSLYDQNPVNPSGHMWYLSALMLWRLAAVLLRPLAKPQLLAMGAAVTCLAPRLFAEDAQVWGAPTNDTNPFALKLAINYFFFFTLGLATDMEGLRRLSKVWGLRTACCVLTVSIPCLFASDTVAKGLETHVADLYDFKQQAALRDVYGHAKDWVPRLFALTVVCCTGFAGMFCLPAAKQWYTSAGGMTMYPYVLHVAVIAPMSQLRVFPNTERTQHLENAAMWIPGLILLPMALCFLLTTKLVRLVFWPVLEPAWLLLLLRPSSCTVATLAPRHLGIRSTADWAKWACLEALVFTATWAVQHARPALWPHAIVGFLALAALEHWCGTADRVFSCNQVATALILPV